MDDLKGFVKNKYKVFDGVSKITIYTANLGLLDFYCFDSDFVSSLCFNDLINVYVLERTVFDYVKQRLCLEFFAYKFSKLESAEV